MESGKCDQVPGNQIYWDHFTIIWPTEYLWKKYQFGNCIRFFWRANARVLLSNCKICLQARILSAACCSAADTMAWGIIIRYMSIYWYIYHFHTYNSILLFSTCDIGSTHSTYNTRGKYQVRYFYIYIYIEVGLNSLSLKKPRHQHDTK